MKTAFLAVWGTFVSVSCHAQQPNVPYRYSAAFVDVRQQLNVFPFDGESYVVPLPIALINVTYSGDGSMLFGTGSPLGGSHLRGLIKVEFNPTRAESQAGTSELGIFSAAFSAANNQIITSGKYEGKCGIFRVDPELGQVRMIISNSTCDYAESWVRISLSPDGKRAIAYRRPRLEIINLEEGTAQSFGDSIAGAWSPDGKWLALLESKAPNHTRLLDAKTLGETRVLGSSNVQWSPDSRYILGERVGFCLAYWATFVAIDIQTGKERTIASSRCKVNLNTTGWVDNSIRP
jgi:WD40 repeat protein